MSSPDSDNKSKWIRRCVGQPQRRLNGLNKPGTRPQVALKFLQGVSTVWLGVSVEDRKYGLPRIDQLRMIESRNLSGKFTSFRLQMSKYRFYPDFLWQLNDERVLTVEYKGAHLWADAEEKRAVGTVWASRSDGRCLFGMPTEGDFSVISRMMKQVA